MDFIIRNVRDIESGERQVLEHVLGQKLAEHQQLVFQVITVAQEVADKHDAPVGAGLPDWCNVFSDLSDEQVAQLDDMFGKRADLTRITE